jgi:hypothetical protein
MPVKEYIKYKGFDLTCTHPKVKKVHQFGGGPANGPFYHYVAIKMEDGSDKEFKASGDNVTDAIEQCNNFLNTIPE